MWRVAALLITAVAPLALSFGSAHGAASDPKYYFKVVDVKAQKDTPAGIPEMARELLDKELRSRPEFTAEVGAGPVASEAELLAALEKRRLRGFRVSVRLDRVSQGPREPRPGGRLKQMGVDVKLSVFGTTFPGEKLAFSGDGEAMLEGEVVESRREEEITSMTKEAMTLALKQAVDQAVTKLSLPKSVPHNEKARKRRRARKTEK